MKISHFAAFLMCLSFGFSAFGQDDFVISRSKSIKTEYTPKPKDFKIKDLSWGAIGEGCVSSDVQFGAWFKIYPQSSQIKVTVSTGYNWGDLSDPVIYLAYLDTIDGVETLVPLGCERFSGDKGDFALEVYGLRRGLKHYLLVGGGSSKEKFALYLTEKFDQTQAFEPITTQNAPVKEELNEAKDNTSTSNTTDEGPDEPEQRATEDAEGAQAIIIGRMRKKNGKALKDEDVWLLDDGLGVQSTVTTDESGVFRFEGVMPDRINLVKVAEDEDKVMVDMFIYDPDGKIIGRGISLGHQLYSFKEQQAAFNEMNILTEKDVVVMVKRGKSTMTGKVVDGATYLIGRPDIRVGLYTPQKRLLRNAITDHDGKFMFTQLDDRDYIVRVDHNPDEDYVEIVLTDDENEPYAISTSEDQAADGYFRFRKLPMDYHEMDTVQTSDQASFQHHYYTMLSEEEPGIPYELHSIVFEVGSSTLPGKIDELDQLARELIESDQVRIKIDGHTDDVGTERVNRKLSLQRAEAVKTYLVKKGVESHRMRCEGYGSKQPISDNETPEGRSTNRRVEFSIEIEQ